VPAGGVVTGGSGFCVAGGAGVVGVWAQADPAASATTAIANIIFCTSLM
jgi:hypothetical protein